MLKRATPDVGVGPGQRRPRARKAGSPRGQRQAARHVPKPGARSCRRPDPELRARIRGVGRPGSQMRPAWNVGHRRGCKVLIISAKRGLHLSLKMKKMAERTSAEAAAVAPCARAAHAWLALPPRLCQADLTSPACTPGATPVQTLDPGSLDQK